MAPEGFTSPGFAVNPEAVAGFSAGFVSTAALYPLDVLKVKFQAGHLRSGFWQGLSGLLSHSGRVELYRGFLTGLASSSLAWCQYFYLYSHMKSLFRRELHVEKLHALQHLGASFLTGCIVQTTLCPIWVVKLNIQLGIYPNFFSGLSGLWHSEGVSGLYRGLIPGLWGCLHAAVQFAVYEEMQQRFNIDRIATFTLISTFVSKTAATLATSPLEVVKTRVRIATSKERSFLGAARLVYGEQGLYGFYRGTIPALVRIMPAQALMFLTYEQTKKFLVLLSCTYREAQTYEELWALQAEYAATPETLLECRMGVAAVWFRMASMNVEAGNFQLAHNLHQMAMASFWDASRAPGGVECLQETPLWGLDWNAFMDQYLKLAFHLKRHEPQGLPSATISRGRRDRNLKIAIASVCAYAETHKLHGIDQISIRNRKQYVTKNPDYEIVFMTENPVPDRHPVWSAIALPLALLETGQFDYVAWMDCDAMFIDLERTIEDLISLYPDADFYTTEDGRGLSGGNWIAKNSDFAKNLLSNSLNNPVFDRWDLKDQFSLLWQLLRPSVNLSPEALAQTWGGMGYPDQVRLIPQKYINAYPWALCRPSHHCFEDGEDSIVSFITLGSLSRDMAFAMLQSFAGRLDFEPAQAL